MNPRSSERRPKVSLARAISKLGLGSRSTAREWIAAGRVQINGTVQRDPELRVDMDRDRIEVTGIDRRAVRQVYVALNKPRGLVTTASDELGRPTVYSCLPADLAWVAPVGRLDLESEGLLLFTNDSRWGDRILDPKTDVPKRYHVRLSRPLAPEEASRLERGVVSRGETLRAAAVRPLEGEVHRAADSAAKAGEWIEIVLEEGRNRQIRRMIESLGAEVDRLIRVAIGSLELGNLAPGEWRLLTAAEVEALDPRKVEAMDACAKKSAPPGMNRRAR